MISSLYKALTRRIFKLAYKVYEKKLWNEIKGGPIPAHVGLILDGNRRWARKIGLNHALGHEAGFEKLKEVLRWCWELGVKTVTIYAFSTENFRRSKDEVEHLMKLSERGFKVVLANEDIHKNKVQVRAIGRVDLLPDFVKKAIEEAEAATKSYDRHRLNVAIAYGGRAEIVDAAKRIAYEVQEGKLKPDEIDEEVFEQRLYTSGDPDPDLIIRTSGEERLSGFLLWQSAYSELCFLDVYWPDIRKIDLWRAIRTYQRRQRRFGL